MRVFRSGQLRALVLAAALTLGPAAGAQSPDLEETGYVSAHRCVVVATLFAIHETEMKTSQDQNRFLILARRTAEQDYVQCVLVDFDANIHCEAASGFYETPKGAPRTSFVDAPGRKALAAHGFSLDDSRGNFVKEFPVAGPEDFEGIADMLLSTLYETYDGERAARLEIVAPDADVKAMEQGCLAMS